MREFGITELRAKLLAAGFREVDFLTENLPEIGVFFDQDVSQPLIARKEKFVMEAGARAQMIDVWRETQEDVDRLEKQIRMASESRWVRLGRKLGVGPKFD
jgi:hypothetical protein